MKKQKYPVPQPWPWSNISLEATPGLLVSDVHLPLITERKKVTSLFKEKSAQIKVTQHSSVKRHFLKLGQARRTKENWYPVTVSQHCFKVSPNDPIFMLFICARRKIQLTWGDYSVAAGLRLQASLVIFY